MPRKSELSCYTKATQVEREKEDNGSYVDIGIGNVQNWNHLKIKVKMEFDCDFVSFLLSLAETVLSSNGGKTVNNCIGRGNEKTDLRILSLTDDKRESIDANQPDDNCDKAIAEKLPKNSCSDVTNIQSVPETEGNKETSISRNTKVDKFQCVPQDIISQMCCICDEIHSSRCPAFDSYRILPSTETNSVSDSLPVGFHYDTVNAKHGLSIFTDVFIGKFTWFGPLQGVAVSEKQIPDDSDMKHIWEVGEGCFIDTKDEDTSNWLRHVRPAPSRSLRNLATVSVEGLLHFVSTSDIYPSQELMYWTDSSGAWATKKLEKTSCGGCNIQFEHPVYYRLHCLIFHEASLSLTVRKYHCKICSAPVLGKQNIIKHAILLHNGKGAYQCPFCDKFFLKLSYLEMHKNYGCSANPHRTRPLCDYCGRKFSQPQKLKVHIKRMHSDLSEVLKEFQCRKCLKVLGSRATLQRHVKEVHESPMFSCEKCNKAFTNKSNLKIHMLTHSGVKPFKCQEKDCNAAFTTKQCLQFHYRKAHGLNEKQIPRIRRSIEYTFNAYAGAPHDPSRSDEDLLDIEVNEVEEEHNEQSNVQRKPCEGREDSRDWDDADVQNRYSEENEADSELDVTGDYDNFHRDETFHRTENYQRNDGFNEPSKYVPVDNFETPNDCNEDKNNYMLNRDVSVSCRETLYSSNDIPRNLNKNEARSYDQLYQHFRYPYEQYYPLEPIIVDLSHSSEIHRPVDKVYYPLSPVYVPPKSPPTPYSHYN